jgi:hypothetical protein
MSKYPKNDKNLEYVFPETSEFHDRILYDKREGSYYDAYSDFYISLDEFHSYCKA